MQARRRGTQYQNGTNQKENRRTTSLLPHSVGQDNLHAFTHAIVPNSGIDSLSGRSRGHSHHQDQWKGPHLEKTIYCMFRSREHNSIQHPHKRRSSWDIPKGARNFGDAPLSVDNEGDEWGSRLSKDVCSSLSTSFKC